MDSRNQEHSVWDTDPSRKLDLTQMKCSFLQLLPFLKGSKCMRQGTSVHLASPREKKLPLRVIMEMIQPKIDEKVGEIQFGFRKEKCYNGGILSSNVLAYGQYIDVKEDIFCVYRLL